MMNTDNLANLKDTLKYQGFGDLMNEQLEKAIRNEEKEFKLSASISHDLPVSVKDDPLTKDRMTYELNFKQGKNGIYYFNSYQAKLESPIFQDRQQQFYLDNGRTYTAKEAYNLLSGRSVYKQLESKEGNRYKAFVQLDFDGERKPNGNYPVKSYHEKFGFNVSEALSKLPLKFSSIEDRDRLIKSLEKGNLQKVQMADGQMLYAKTVPSNRALKFYDEKLQSTQVMGAMKVEHKAKPESAPAMTMEQAPEEKASGGRKKSVKV
jgi:hypothetical protein